MALIMKEPWWTTDSYTTTTIFPDEISEYAGPKGLAVVAAYENGSTSKGWGLTDRDGREAFMPNYLKRAFDIRRYLPGYEKGQHAVALVMRSVNLVAIDIDGKNGGLQHAEELIAGAPRTLAETSKSGNGYHLFYSLPDEWDEKQGFALLKDTISVVRGVDIRAVGCVYHHPQQRWNDAPIVPLPKHILKKLTTRTQRQQETQEYIKKVIDTAQDEDILMLHQKLEEDLAAPIPEGRRNNTLFAIGQQMKLAKHPDWQNKVFERAEGVGLSSDEASKLVKNIESYDA